MNYTEAKRFMETALSDNFFRLAYVNIITGEYCFVTGGEDIDAPDIFEYIKSSVDTKNNEPENIREYLRFSDPEFARKRVFSGEKRLTRFFRPDKNHGLMNFSIIVPKNCSIDNPWVAFGWSHADMYTSLMADSLSVLSSIYYKILKINITKDSFQIIKLMDEERELFPNTISKISDWWKKFSQDGYVHPEEKDMYDEFTDMDKLREHFRTDGSKEICRYKRKMNGQYRWVQMDIEKSIEYSDENQVLLLYIKDIQKEYNDEMERYTKLVDTYNRDPLTHLYNRHKFNTDISELQDTNAPYVICIYIDVNGLHELNNNLGHKKGDDMLCAVANCLRKYFSDSRIYRIGGDEFVVLDQILQPYMAEQKLELTRRELAEDNYAISAGLSRGKASMSVHRIVGTAELAMRKDKDHYYKTHDASHKKRTMNEELEKMLAQKRDEEYFINAMEEKFPGVYIVDLKKDMARSILVPGYFSSILEDVENTFSCALNKYVDMYVVEKDSQKLKELLNYDSLMKNLSENDYINIFYTKTDGEKMKLNLFYATAPGTDVADTVWIFSKET